MKADVAFFLPDLLIINVPEIDEQHAELFARLESLKNICVESNTLPYDQALALLDALRHHYQTEESMARQAAVDFVLHAGKHAAMLKAISKTVRDVHEGRTDAFSLIRYIEYWFERHIQEEDQSLGRHLLDNSLSE